MQEVADKPWLAEKEDKRRLSELVDLWYEHHGKTIKTGEMYYRRLLYIAEMMGNPIAAKCSSRDFTRYRVSRTNAVTKSEKSLSPKTQNLELTLLKSVFNELIRLKEWRLPNPFGDIRKINVTENELSFLTSEQIKEMFTFMAQTQNGDEVVKVLKICLATGARIMEAANLKGSQLSKYKITFTQTKGKKNRTVPIFSELYHELYQQDSGPLFTLSYIQIYTRIKNCFPDLPARQATHVLRHTFASHFAPDHLQDAVTKNPLNSL